jgi:uncharacterized protein
MCRSANRGVGWHGPLPRPAVEACRADDSHALGEMACQLGKADGFALVQEADANETSPGKDVLCTLLARFAPCVVLLDELVVYIRQFVESQPLSGGTYDSNLSFIQSLTD